MTATLSRSHKERKSQCRRRYNELYWLTLQIQRRRSIWKLLINAEVSHRVINNGKTRMHRKIRIILFNLYLIQCKGLVRKTYNTVCHSGHLIREEHIVLKWEWHSTIQSKCIRLYKFWKRKWDFEPGYKHFQGNWNGTSGIEVLNKRKRTALNKKVNNGPITLETWADFLLTEIEQIL